jgi:RNA polymerase sigma factor (TIGR02999 family)
MRLVASRDQERPENSSGAPEFSNRGHFFAAAAEAMRRILIDNARRKGRPKHGGDRQRVDLDEALVVADPREDLLALDEALTKFSQTEPVKAELVKLRYFAGLPHQEAAQAMGISRATADRYWAYAKAFLRCEMEDTKDL